MRRFLAFWIVLAPACWLGVIGVSLVVFRHVDLTYYTFAVLVTAPVLQALVLAAATAAPRVHPLPLSSTLREPLIVPVVVLDAILLGAAWLWPDQPLVGLGAGTRTHALWIGTKAMAAGLFLLALACRPARAGRLPDGKIGVAAGALALLLAGWQAFVPWIEPAATTINPWNIRTWPTLYFWLASYGSLFIALNGLILHAGSRLRRHVEAADFWMQAAVALNFGVGLIAVHGFFRLPELVEPWRALAWTAGSLAATAALLAAILASTWAGTGKARVS